jgi:hypothetical protein
MSERYEQRLQTTDILCRRPPQPISRPGRTLRMGGHFVPGRKSKQWRRIRSCFLSCSSFLAIANLTSSPARGQTASTGALAGVVLDPSGVALSGVAIHLANQEGDRNCNRCVLWTLWRRQHQRHYQNRRKRLPRDCLRVFPQRRPERKRLFLEQHFPAATGSQTKSVRGNSWWAHSQGQVVFFCILPGNTPGERAGRGTGQDSVYCVSKHAALSLTTGHPRHSASFSRA